MTPADPALIEGASVGELLQQVEDQFYWGAVHPPSARALLTAWPSFAASSANLLRAVIGPRVSQHLGSTRNPEVHPVLHTAVRLMRHLDTMGPTWRSVVPDPTLLRAAQLLGAAADLVEADRDRRHALAHDTVAPDLQAWRPLRARQSRAKVDRAVAPDPAVVTGELTDSDQLAALLRISQHTLAGVQLVTTTCGLARANRIKGQPKIKHSGALGMGELFHAGVLASRVLAAGDGHPVFGRYDAIRVPTFQLVDQGDLTARLRYSVHAWKRACLDSPTQRPSIAEVLRSSVETRHLIGLNASLVHAAAATGLIPQDRANTVLAGLLEAQRAWGRVTEKLAAVTDGVTPGPEHVAASLALADSVRTISRSPDGGWKSPEDVAMSVPLGQALVAARTALHEVMDVARVHQAMTTRMILVGGLYAKASSMPLTDDRVAAAARDGFVQVTLDEATGLRTAQSDAITQTDRARRQLALLRVPDAAPSLTARGPRQGAPRQAPPSTRA